jgi:antitoxin component HigA of HigAB toxin-antitoxin module
MKHIRDACVAAEISIPDEIDKFFEGETPDPSGVIVEITHREYNAESCSGFEVYLSEIPEDVKIIRFVNSY